MDQPTLTVMLPSYNYGRYLPQAIESILSQSFIDFEFLIIEDGSTDESPEIIRKYMKQDPRIRAIFYEKNGGMLERLNEGMQKAQGTYIHYLAADDYRYPGFLAKVMSLLQSDPEIGLAFTQFHYGPDEEPILENCGFDASSPLLFTPDKLADIFLNYNFKVFSVSSILKTELVRRYHGFDPKLFYMSDWYLFNQICFTNKIALIPEPLSRFRVHQTNFSNVHRHHKETKRGIYRYLLAKIDLPENTAYREQLKKSGLLSQVFQDFFWRLLFNPKYLTFWPYINRKYPVKKRIFRSIKKKIGIPVQ